MKSRIWKRPGNLGKLVSKVPGCILFGTKFLRDWYDCNPYRRYDLNEDDSYGKVIQKDILVSKRPDSCLSDARVVLVVNSSSAGTINNKILYQYNVTAYFDSGKNCEELNINEPVDGIELSTDGYRASTIQTIIKSNVEDNYKRFTTVKDLSAVTLAKALDDAVKSYDMKKITFEEMMQYYYTSRLEGTFPTIHRNYPI